MGRRDIPQRHDNWQPAIGNQRNSINDKVLRLDGGSIATVYRTGMRFTVLAIEDMSTAGDLLNRTIPILPLCELGSPKKIRIISQGI